MKPLDLRHKQKLEIKNDPSLVKLRAKRDRCKDKIRRRYGSIRAAKGSKWDSQYDCIQSQLCNTLSRLSRMKLKESIESFHYNIDSIEINKQLEGDFSKSLPSPQAIRYELLERETVVSLLFVSQKQDDHGYPGRGAQSKLIHNLVLLCKKQETQNFRRSCTSKPIEVISRYEGSVLDGHDRVKETEWTYADIYGGPVITQAADGHARSNSSGVRNDKDDVNKNRASKRRDRQVCLICLGDEGLPYARRNKNYERKDTLRKHLNTHLRHRNVDQPLECPHPLCTVWLENVMHFKNHAARVHKIYY